MKKHILSAIVFLTGALLAACGTENKPEETFQGIGPGIEDLSAITNRTEYYDLIVESESLFDLGLWEKNPQDQNIKNFIAMGGNGYLPVGTQFLMGEPVQLWADASSEVSDIYLYRKDGSSTLVLQDIPSRFVRSSPEYQWYLDREGDFYCIQNANYGINNTQVSVVKILSSGKILYETTLQPGLAIDDVCQPEDGRVYVQLRDALDDTRTLAEMDPATGEILPDFEVEIPYGYEVYLGSAGNSPAVTGSTMDVNRGIRKMDSASGSLEPILYFTGTSYGWHSGLQLCDFQVLENGSIELLWTDFNGLNCLLDRLRMEKVEKIPIVCRGIFYSDTWLGERVARFNRENKDYHVILEDCGLGNDISDFARLTSVQVGTGKGPDILCGKFIQEYIGGMLEKGALEELNPYMAASGIREEDYFPPVFATWRQGDRIYGVNYRMSIWGYTMAEEVLGSREVPDIETLADALLAWKGGGVYQKGLDSGQVLSSFLEGTDSLWGMVDWEKGGCEFNTPLFGKLLEAARRYGDDGKKDFAFSIRERVSFRNLIGFEGQAEREAAGKVTCGTMFDDGCYAASLPNYAMAINANSRHKEGAWEFISFLIGEESQSENLNWYIQPINRNGFETWMQEKVIYELTTKRIKNGVPYTPSYYGADTSEEKQAEYRKAIEEARPMPMRIAPILTIILEEAEDYFNGNKNAEEISKVINNRVQLYLDERK